MRFREFIRQVGKIPPAWRAFVMDRETNRLIDACEHDHQTGGKAERCAEMLLWKAAAEHLGIGKAPRDLHPPDPPAPGPAPAPVKLGWKDQILEVLHQLELIEQVRLAPCSHKSMQNRTFIADGSHLEWCGVCGSLKFNETRFFPTRAIDFEGELRP